MANNFNIVNRISINSISLLFEIIPEKFIKLRIRKIKCSKLLKNSSCSVLNKNNTSQQIYISKFLKIISYAFTVKSLAFSPCGIYVAIGTQRKVTIFKTNPYEDFLNANNVSNNVINLSSRSNKSKRSIKSNISVEKDNSFSSNNNSKFGQKILEVSHHKDWINDLNYSNNGEYLASGSRDWSTIIYFINPSNIHKFGKLHLKILFFEEVLCNSFSPCNRYIATSGNDLKIAIHCISLSNLFMCGKVVLTLEGNAQLINSLSYSRQGSLLASGSNDHSVKVYEINLKSKFNSNSQLPDIYNEKSNKTLYNLKDHKDEVTGVNFNNQFDYLCTSSLDKTVFIYEINNSNYKILFKFVSSLLYTKSFSFNHDGNSLTILQDGYITIYGMNPKSKLFGKPLFEIKETIEDFTKLNYSPCGNYLAITKNNITILYI